MHLEVLLVRQFASIKKKYILNQIWEYKMSHHVVKEVQGYSLIKLHFKTYSVMITSI